MEQWRSELYHFGIPGMKWGKRNGPPYPLGSSQKSSAEKKRKYHSTGLIARIARRSNDKVDKGFDRWKKNAANKERTINLGKSANEARLTYEKNRRDKSAKSAYKTANKAYKKALRTNTTAHKGAIRQEVGRDSARKHLSEAKRIQKQLKADPLNKQLQKQYNAYMSKHDIERAKARRAKDVGIKRSRKIAAMKGVMTKKVKGAAATAAVTAGLYGVNKYLNSKGKGVKLDAAQIVDYAKKGKGFLGFLY